MRGEPATGVDEIGASGDRAVQRLRMAPALDAGMIPAEQLIRHGPTSVAGRPRERRLLQQASGTEALLHGAGGVAHRPLEQAADRLDDQARPDLPARQHDVADAHLTVCEMLAHPVVDALVAAAQQAESVESGQLVRHVLVEAPPARTQQQQRTRWIVGFYGVEDRFGPQQHAWSAAERSIVHAAVRIRRVLARVVAAQLEHTSVASLAEQPNRTEVIDQPRKDREHVDSHGQGWS